MVTCGVCPESFRGSVFFFFFKQKTAYEMRISDWSSDVCSSDLLPGTVAHRHARQGPGPVCIEHPQGRIEVDVQGSPPGADGHPRIRAASQIGRAPCRERVCQYV